VRFELNWLKVISFSALGLLVIPVILILYEGFGPFFSSAGYSELVFRSIELSLISSIFAVLASVALFTPVAYYFARNKNSVGETLSDIPAAVPHPIIGIAILILASPLTPFGKFLASIGINLFDSILGLVIVLTVVSAPVYIRAVQAYFESMNPEYENYALGLGASRLRTFVSVVVPISRGGLLEASIIAMSRAMSEYGSIVIIAYEILQNGAFFGVSPASVLVVNLYTSTGLSGGAVTASAVMILLAIALMVGLRIVRQRSGWFHFDRAESKEEVRRLHP
jgi:molybdate/tungstate transport system permease protein